MAFFTIGLLYTDKLIWKSSLQKLGRTGLREGLPVFFPPSLLKTFWLLRLQFAAGAKTARGRGTKWRLVKPSLSRSSLISRAHRLGCCCCLKQQSRSLVLRASSCRLGSCCSLKPHQAQPLTDWTSTSLVPCARAWRRLLLWAEQPQQPKCF